MNVRIPQHVVYRTLVSETVMLNVQTGRYYGLNETAGLMLDKLERGLTLDDAAAELARELGAPEEKVRQDIEALCSELAANGLVELDKPTDRD